MRCNVCHNMCDLNEGNTGLCRARVCRDGVIQCENYGRITSIALDPIQKKPLKLFHPGSNILSVGSYGCNLRCPFCQNHTISYGFYRESDVIVRNLEPSELAAIAAHYRDKGNIGVAFTYNEPLVGYEYVVDTAIEVHKLGMKTVLVSNGCVDKSVAQTVIPHIDATNIDLKGFDSEFYESTLHGSRKMVMDFIEMAAEFSHVEVTTLIIPGCNDSNEEIREIASWIASLDNGRGKEDIALHISRYFPRFRMNIPPTDVDRIYELRDIASEYLNHVFTGNC